MLNRRRFLKNCAGAGMMAVGGYSFWVEPHHTVVERVEAPLVGLPVEMEGFRIVAMSDFHLLPFTKLPHIEHAVAEVNALKPDLVVLLGDYVDETVEAIHDLAPAFARLNARFGTFGILGNHDHWNSPLVVMEVLQKHGIQVLCNQGVPITVGQHTLYLAGLDDAWVGKPYVKTAMANRPKDAPVVLLVHEPDYVEVTSATARPALQLSGHSHGGQVRIPGYGALHLPQMGAKYDCGAYRVGETLLYTTRGIGLVRVPMRFNCPPEITELTLRRA